MRSDISVFRPETISRGADRVLAGEWWEYRGADETRPDFDIRPGAVRPSEPLTLLVSDVRVHDGDIHSVHLAPHPCWKEGSAVRVLSGDFFRDYVRVETREAERRRDAESAAAMARVSLIQADISSGAPEDQVLSISSEISERERKKSYEEWKSKRIQSIWKEVGSDRERGLRLVSEIPGSIPQDEGDTSVPAVLIPGGDVAAARRSIETQILRMKATEAWIGRKVSDMRDTMHVVGAFQSEKVLAVTASISVEARRAEDILRNVETMNLFLGKGCSLESVKGGNPAPAEEPLHMMQRMLYLDEEIFIADRFRDGFDGDDVHSLPDILSANPELVSRMMPHQRCVVIAKARRNDRPFEFTKGDMGQMIRQVFEKIRQSEADSRIFVLIRDGENVRLVTADEQTSKATRLFPSAAEISGIYAGKDGEIGVGDIEYSDRRNEFDSRALFYKRFLLMFWGLHEREGAFGDFMPKGLNWLRHDVTGERVRFVHDEENVISDGRPPVSVWIESLNAAIAPGSVVIAQSSRAMGPETAPTTFKRNDKTSDYDRVRFPDQDFVLMKVAKRGDTLSGKIPCRKDRWSEDATVTDAPVMIRDTKGRVTDGVICLDIASSAEISGYIESRAARQSYMNWIDLFDKALPFIRAREAAEAGFSARLGGDGQGQDARIAAAWVRRAKRGESLEEKDAPKVRSAMTALASARRTPGSAPVVISRTGVALSVSQAPQPDGYVPGWLEATDRKGVIRAISSSGANLEDFMVARGGPEIETMMSDARRDGNRLLKSPEDVDALLNIDTGLALRMMRGEFTGEEAEKTVRMFSEFSSPNGYVHNPFLLMTVGAATCRNSKEDTPDGRTVEIGIQVDMIRMLAANGMAEEMRRLSERRYRNHSPRTESFSSLPWFRFVSETFTSGYRHLSTGLHDVAGASSRVGVRLIMSHEIDIFPRKQAALQVSDLAAALNPRIGASAVSVDEAEAMAERGAFLSGPDADEILHAFAGSIRRRDPDPSPGP